MKGFRNRIRTLFVALSVLLVGAVASATTYTSQYDVTDLVGQLEADITGAATGLFPVMITALGLVIGWAFIKRFARKV